MRYAIAILACLSAVLGACQRTPDEHVRLVPQLGLQKPRRVEFSPVDENRLLVMEASGRVGLWDVSEGGKAQLFSSFGASAIDATFSADGRSVVSAGFDGRVRRWTLDGRLEWVSRGGHGGPARAVAASSDLIVSGGEDGAIRLWGKDGAPVGELLDAHDGPVMSIDISTRGDLVSLGGDEVARLWKRAPNASTSSSPPTFEPVILHQPQQRRYPGGFTSLLRHETTWGWDRSVAFSPRDDVIAAVLFDGSLRFWSAAGLPGAVVAKAHQGRSVRALSFSPRGDLLATAGFDGTVRLWNPDGSRHRKALNIGQIVYSVTFSSAAHMATAGRDEAVRIWKPDGSPVTDLPRGHADRVITVELAPDAPVFAVADWNGGVRLWNFDGSPRGEPLLGHDGVVLALGFSPRQDVLATADREDTMRLWGLDGKPRSQPVTIRGSGLPQLRLEVAFSPQGDALAVGTDWVQLWKENRRLWQRQLRRGDSVASIAFSPRGDFIVTGSWLGDVQVWNLDGSARTQALKQRWENIATLAVAPDGDYFAAVVGGSNPIISLFNLDGSPRGELEGHFGTVSTVAFSPTGRLVSGGSDGVVRFWTLPSAQVETMDVGLPIDQLGFWRDLLWVRADGGSVFFYDQAGKPLATMLLRHDNTLVYTLDGWYGGEKGSGQQIRMFSDSGAALGADESGTRLAPERVLQLFTDRTSP